MNIHTTRPDRSDEAVQARKKAIEQSRAMNMRQGYIWDPVLEEANDRYIAGDITSEEMLQELHIRFKQA